MKGLNTTTAIFLIIAIIFGIYKSIQLSDTRDSLSLALITQEITQSNLDITKLKLDSAETDLTETQVKLGLTETRLDVTSAELQNTVAELQTANTELQDTKNTLTTTQNTLAGTKSQLNSVENQLDNAQSANSLMRDQYSDLRDTVNARWNWNENAMDYITPQNAEVTAKASFLAGNLASSTSEIWMDYRRFYNWVVNNIKYNSDTYSAMLPPSLGGEVSWFNECWKMPEETLADLSGDCEDMATLLASLMMSYNNDTYAVWAIGISNDDSGHLAVAYPVQGGQMTILDPTGNYYTGDIWGTLMSNPVYQSVNDWLNHWRSKMPGAEVDMVFSNDFYREFSGTAEFIDWVINR